MIQGCLLEMLERPVVLQPPAELDEGLARLLGHVPVRLQRSRRRGARTPEGASSIGRGTLYFNPFARAQLGHARGVLMYEDWLDFRMSDLQLERRGFCPAEIDALHRLRDRLERNLDRLFRRNLVCSCPLTSRWCHGNPLLRRANPDLTDAQLFEAQRLHNDAAALAAAKRAQRRSFR